MATQISKKRKFVADGVFYAELNEVLTRELAEDGYSGVEVRVTPMRTEIIIRATRTQNVLGEKGRRIRELTSVVQKRFKFPENGVELYAEKVNNRGLCAIAQAESLRYKLLGGLAVRRYLHLSGYLSTRWFAVYLLVLLACEFSCSVHQVIFTASWVILKCPSRV
ncbi:PREDICTED: 40S ribosomal protein S3-1-like [Populus euphratica]|uniref:40S ribosomal protein S3-1-like n=1 Tax=Populus euphratica TaxID=75702 RepID=A0AAJ6UGC0_POPEU|nr:PREDICTED: 40S ribosomal protein S3-1-like [Populus euphratica]